MRYKPILYILILLILALNVYAITGSIGNARAVLRPNVTEGQTEVIDRTVLVENVNDEDIEINLEVGEDFQDMVELIDQSFILKPQEDKKARFTLTISDPYTHEGSIIVKFNPIDSDGPGVALTSKIIIIGTQPNPEEELEEETENNEEELEEETENNEEDTLSFGLKNPIEDSKIDKKTGMIKEPNPLIGIGILVLFIVVGIVIFFLFKRNSTKTEGGKKK